MTVVTMSTSKHYQEAERLLEEGRRVVDKIQTASLHRASIESTARLSVNDTQKVWELTRRMDELGKKAMGIWAQAQVHATLATVAIPLEPSEWNQVSQLEI